MRTGFLHTKDLICCIIAVLLLLSICMTIDYADEDVIVSGNKTLNIPKDTVVVNGTEYVPLNHTAKSVIKSTSKVHYVHSTVTITAKPSCGCGYGYHWHTRTFINYCPHCHRYGVLSNVHKYAARHEQELTCRHCGADYCGVCGKEKYSWSNVYLRRA